MFSGNQVARHRGEGIEFADLRPFTPGDRVRRVNWRATARRGVPWVNEAHPGAEHRRRALPRHVRRGAARRHGDARPRRAGGGRARARTTCKEKDRVGLVSFGGVLNWLTAASGTTQLYRIVDSLLDAEIMLSYAWKDLDVIPTRTLPPRALVHRAQPAARRAGRRRAARPAGARLRPRRRRALAVPVRRGGRERDRAARVPALAASPGGAALAVRVAGRPDRRVARRRAARGGGGGGEGIQAPRPSRARVATGAAAFAAAAGPRGVPGAAGHRPAVARARARRGSRWSCWRVGLRALARGAVIGLGPRCARRRVRCPLRRGGRRARRAHAGLRRRVRPGRGARLLVDRAARAGLERADGWSSGGSPASPQPASERRPSPALVIVAAAARVGGGARARGDRRASRRSARSASSPSWFSRSAAEVDSSP